MPFKIVLFAGALALAPALSAAQIMVEDAYARAASEIAISGAAFMSIRNGGDTDDRLIAVRSDVAERVELHTHAEDADGTMRMRKVEDGFDLPAGAMLALERGGHHVMFLGLRQPLRHGDTVTLTLEFDRADPIAVAVPVDLNRRPPQSGHGDHDG